MEVNFKTTQTLSLGTSYGTIKTEKNVKVEATIRTREDNPLRGSFEFYDVETGGDTWYAEGGLWFNAKKELTEYDGVFSLPDFILNKLKELGYTINL